jgi:hypothetical protein
MDRWLAKCRWIAKSRGFVKDRWITECPWMSNVLIASNLLIANNIAIGCGARVCGTKTLRTLHFKSFLVDRLQVFSRYF